MKYPRPWVFNDENNSVVRDCGPDEGEIWCEFTPGMQPEGDEIDWLLEALNNLD